MFEPVGVAFICGSISAAGMAEASEYGMKGHPLRPLFVSERQPGKFESTINLTVKHGVRSALEYARTGSLQAAHAVSNPENAPHLEFVDMGGHGYAVVAAGASTLETEFVCIRASTNFGWRPVALPGEAYRRMVEGRGQTETYPARAGG